MAAGVAGQTRYGQRHMHERSYTGATFADPIAVRYHTGRQGVVQFAYRPGLSGLDDEQIEQLPWRDLPSAVAFAWGEQLQADPAAAAPWGEQLDLTRERALALADALITAARRTGAEQLETEAERARRLGEQRARQRLGAFDIALDAGHPVARALQCLEDVWDLVEEIYARDRTRLTIKQLRSALQAGKRAGYVTSRRNLVAGRTEYALTEHGMAWVHGGDVEQYITTPGAEPDIDHAKHRAQRLAREQALAEQDRRRADGT